MLFEAEIKGRFFSVSVVEDRHDWKVTLQEKGHDLVLHTISKRHHLELEQILLFVFKGGSYLMDVTGADTQYNVYTRGSYRTVKIYNDEMILHETLKRGGSLGNDSALTSGMPGKILKVQIQKGDVIKEGEPLIVMEAMKMENEMRAPKDVTIKDVLVKVGDNVEAGCLLVTFEVLKI
jgi:acetyl/propionyl-CoA carboxylase alpha subunit